MLMTENRGCKLKQGTDGELLFQTSPDSIVSALESNDAHEQLESIHKSIQALEYSKPRDCFNLIKCNLYSRISQVQFSLILSPGS